MKRILLIEDNPADARLIREFIAEVQTAEVVLEWKDTLAKGLQDLSQSDFDAVLLDLSLPDSRGLDTFFKIHERSPTAPILILTGIQDEKLAVEAVRQGAQDYLVKGQVDGNLLVRAINYAIERHHLLAELEKARQEAQRLTLIDDLTGLYNRRGFFTLSQQQWRLSKRNKQGFTLLFCDLDNLKAINDQYGHQAGDQALTRIAKLLTATFRESDIIARMGGDEFAILAIEADPHRSEILVNRLKSSLDELNKKAETGKQLSLSIGCALFDPETPQSIEEVLAHADAQMYQEKQQKKPDLRDGS
jgi:diguanylate cyclase (GGDEF)-like protein